MKEGARAFKRTREDHTVKKGVQNGSRPNVPPALGHSPIPIRSDIDVTTHSHTASPTKKKKLYAFDQSFRPDLPRADAVLGQDQSQPDLDLLKTRIQQLEEERDDYRCSLHKEREIAMDRGQQLLLLRAGIGRAKHGEGPSARARQQRPLSNKNEGTGETSGNTEANERHDSPTERHIPSGGTKAPNDSLKSSNTRLERQLQQRVEDLSKRLSEAENENADRASQVLKLLKYRWQDEQFSAQSRLTCLEDCKLAHDTEESGKDLGTAKSLLKKVPSNGMKPEEMALGSAYVRLLRETNDGLSEKLQKCHATVTKLQNEVQELRSSLRATVCSRDELTTTLEDANQSHSREKAALEGRARSLESDVAQAHLEIEKIEEEKTSMRSLQDLAAESLARLRSSHTRDRQVLAGQLESLGDKNKQLESEKSSLAENLSEIKENFKTLNLSFVDNQSQLRNAESKFSSLEAKVQEQNSCLWNASTKHADDVNALEARIKELSESLSKATTEIANRDEGLNTLRAASLERERSLQKTREGLKNTVEKLVAKNHETAKAEAEISRLRSYEHAVTEHDRAVKKLEEGREEMVRQQQERLKALMEARQQLIAQRDQNRGLQQRNVSLDRKVRELETLKREDEARFVQFLQSVETQVRRQIEESWEGRETATEIGQPCEATTKQLEERLQKKLDMVEHELQWYRDDRATIYNEYRRLEQWRHEMASNVAARLSMVSGSRQSGR